MMTWMISHKIMDRRWEYWAFRRQWSRGVFWLLVVAWPPLLLSVVSHPRWWELLMQREDGP